MPAAVTAVRVSFLAAALSLAGCGDGGDGALEEFAASACASVQTWIDAIEDDTTALSRAVTPLERSSERVEHYRVFTRTVRERTDDLIRQLRRIAPSSGDGRDAADHVLEALAKSLAVTDALVELADGYPDGDDEEDLAGRISPLLVRLEKAFVHPSRARDELAARFDAFDRVPACLDYADPLS